MLKEEIIKKVVLQSVGVVTNLGTTLVLREAISKITGINENERDLNSTEMTDKDNENEKLNSTEMTDKEKALEKLKTIGIAVGIASAAGVVTVVVTKGVENAFFSEPEQIFEIE
jgi:hypothetical protein